MEDVEIQLSSQTAKMTLLKVLNAAVTFNATMDTCASVAPVLRSALRTNLFVHNQLTAQPVTDVLATYAVPHLAPTAKQTLNVLVARSALEVFAKTKQSKRLSCNDELIYVITLHNLSKLVFTK